MSTRPTVANAGSGVLMAEIHEMIHENSLGLTKHAGRPMVDLTGVFKPTHNGLDENEGASRVRDWDLKWEDQQQQMCPKRPCGGL